MLHPDSGCFLIFQVNTIERYREDGNISLKKSLLLEEKGKAKGSPSVMEKLQRAFRRPASLMTVGPSSIQMKNSSHFSS
jgi:hypothetical protein